MARKPARKNQTSARGPFPEGDRYRPDVEIFHDIYQRIAHDDRLSLGYMQIRVLQGEVALEGFVEHERERRLAEELAAGISGVKNVTNELQLEREHP